MLIFSKFSAKCVKTIMSAIIQILRLLERIHGWLWYDKLKHRTFAWNYLTQVILRT